MQEKSYHVFLTQNTLCLLTRVLDQNIKAEISLFQKPYAKSSILNYFGNCKTSVPWGAMLLHKSVLDSYA